MEFAASDIFNERIRNCDAEKFAVPSVNLFHLERVERNTFANWKTETAFKFIFEFNSAIK